VLAASPRSHSTASRPPFLTNDRHRPPPQHTHPTTSPPTYQALRHPILTAETHNFPSSIAPFPGAQTGVGGRIRDILATGRGAKTLAGLAGYAVGDIRPSLDPDRHVMKSRRPVHVASPLDILLRASDGASDYANKYGEPLLGGFARAMAPWPDADGAEFLKPIMFSAGLGALPDAAVRKRDPRPGMTVVKIGGPAYRVGLGGGAASSKVGGEPELDLQAVQRGDPAMGNRVGRVIRACVEMGVGGGGEGGGGEGGGGGGDDGLLLASVHDQGAGGNANVLKELVAPEGADVYLGRVRRGDASLSPLEVWGAEYQESQGVLVDGERALAALRRVCAREAAPMEVVGQVTGHGRIRVFEGEGGEEDSRASAPLVDLPLQPLLSHRPRRVINATVAVPPPWATAAPAPAPAPADQARQEQQQPPPSSSFDLQADLRAVLATVAVGSKAFLTNKVDRSVTGLVAAQPCVGPLNLPVGDVGVAALSYWGRDGVASALGECPGVGLLDVEVRVCVWVGGWVGGWVGECAYI
jgi:phosphoribosylformylglycinamidine synthase